MTVSVNEEVPIKVFIIDENAIETLCLHDVLEGSEGNFKIVEILPNTAGAMELISSLKPQVILLRVSSSEKPKSLEFIKTVNSQYPDLPLAVISEDNSIKTILVAIKNGASTYLLDSTSPVQLRDAILKTSEHGSVLSPEVARKLLMNLNAPETVPFDASEQEIAILKLVAKGLSNKDIGLKLFISTRTVESHLNHMFVRFNVTTRTQAVLHALKFHIFLLEDPAA